MREESGHERFRRPATGETDFPEFPSGGSMPELNEDESADDSSLQRPVLPVARDEIGEAERDRREYQPGLLDRLLGRTRRQARLNELNSAIASHPDSPMNYVLRGELHLANGDREAAVADFQTAVSLADSEFAQSDWGLIAQAARDRALHGLRRAGRY